MVNGRQCVGCPLAHAKTSFYSHNHFSRGLCPAFAHEHHGQVKGLLFVYLWLSWARGGDGCVQMIFTSPALLLHRSEALKCQEAKTWIRVFSFTHPKPLQGSSWQNRQTTKDTEGNKATKGINSNSNQVSPLCSDAFIQQAFGNVSHVQVFRSHIFHQIKTFVILGLQE